EAARSLGRALGDFSAGIASLLRIPTFRAIAFGGMSASIAGTAFGVWLPTIFVRSHAMSLAEFGMGYGIVSGVAGITGAVSAGARSGPRGAPAPPLPASGPPPVRRATAPRPASRRPRRGDPRR